MFPFSAVCLWYICIHACIYFFYYCYVIDYVWPVGLILTRKITLLPIAMMECFNVIITTYGFDLVEWLVGMLIDNCLT